MSLVVDGLVAGRGGFRVGPVSLVAGSGVRVALLGANGGGKTTLLKTIAGLLRSLAGGASVCGEPVAAMAPAARAARIAYLPAPGEIDAPFAGRHMVALGRIARRGWPGDLHADDYATADAALATVGAAALGPRPFDRLSSGERQLVLIARLLAADAPLCLLDEPTAALDPAFRARVGRALDALAAAGRTLVTATHDAGEARRADLVVTLGADVAVGPPAAVLTPDRLSRVYGEALGLCPTCGRPHV